MAQLKDTVIQGDARVTGTLYAQDGTTTVPGLLSTADKAKLDGITAGAEVNQNTFSTITVGSTNIQADTKTDTLTLVAGDNVTLTPDATNDKITIAATDTTYTPASAIPLMDGTAAVGTSVKYAREDHRHPTDTSRASASDLTTHTGNSTIHITSNERTAWNAKQSALTEGTDYLNKTHLDSTYVAQSSVGANGGIAELDSTGKIPTSQLPSYVDDVLEYASISNFPSTGETGKIYIATDTNLTYRWSGSSYVVISSSLALGETSSTAYRGDRGKTAYDHSQNGDVHVTTTQKTNWNTAYTNSHTHSNKTVLDGISSTDVTNWDNASTNSHTHSNKTVLDGIASTDITAWNGKYTKPSGGIPKTDLASAVQTSLGLADTAVQDNSYVHTDNNYTTTDKNKLAGIASGAEVNVQSDWNQTTTTADDYIKNKPTIPTVTDTYSGTSSNAMSGKAVKQAIDALDGTISGSAGAAKTLTAFSQTDGKVSATFGNIAITTQQLSHASGIRGTNDVTLAPLITTTRANRLAFLPANQIIIEKTTDGGTTWVDAGVSDAVKLGLFSETRSAIYIPLLNGVRSLLCGVRVTFTAMRYNVPSGTTETQKYNYWNSDYVLSSERYCSLTDMYFWLTAVSDSIGVKVERATGAGAKTNAWSTIFNDSTYYMTGWSGSNNIHFSNGTFGGGVNQTGNSWNYRITFMTRGVNGTDTMATSSTTSQQSIMEIRAYGENVWGVANQYMAYDHMYSKDSAQNVTFPAKVTAASFSGNFLIPGDKYYEVDNYYGLNMNNSDIVGMNGLYFNDACDGNGEGINFYRGSNTVDSFRAYNGNLQFSPNRTRGQTGTWYNVYHTNNKPALADLAGDTTHRLVTDTQISAWNAKSDFSGSYDDLTDKPNLTTLAETAELSDAIPSTNYQTVSQAEKDSWNAKSTFSGNYSDLSGKPTIPTTLAQLATDTTHRVVTDAQINQWNSNYTLPPSGVPLNDLSQPVRDLLTNKTSLFESDIIIGDVYFKRYAPGRLMVSEVE